MESLSEVLLDNKELKYLYVKANQLGDAGAKAMGKFISVSKSVLELDLFGCGIEELGGAEIAYSLKSNFCIEKLSVG